MKDKAILNIWKDPMFVMKATNDILKHFKAKPMFRNKPDMYIPSAKTYVIYVKSNDIENIRRYLCTYDIGFIYLDPSLNRDIAFPEDIRKAIIEKSKFVK